MVFAVPSGIASSSLAPTWAGVDPPIDYWIAPRSRLGVRSPAPRAASIEEPVSVLLDIGGEAERMLAREALRALGVALLNRADDAEVILDGALGAVVAPDRDLSDAAHVQQQIVGHVRQHLRAREADDGLVERDVGRGILAQVLARLVAFTEALEQRAESLDRIVGRVQRDEARGHALE